MSGRAAELPLWEPSEEQRRHATLSLFMQWAGRRQGRAFADYDDLWRWSTTDLEGFWDSLRQFFAVRSSGSCARVLSSGEMPDVRWFEGVKLNYAENLLDIGSRPEDSVAILHCSELQQLREMSWGELRWQVGTAAAGLRRLGVRPGDRVVAYMPNIPETVIAFLAVAAIGAVWSSAAPEFGPRSVVDRFAQIEPKILLAVDGYRQHGRDIDRMRAIAEIVAELPTLERIVILPHLASDGALDGAISWQQLMGDGEQAELLFEAVPFEHPLWVLYSSGTTGLPKAIVQSHGGILLEQLKSNMHLDLHPEDRMFWFTTTGWMMWNFLVGCLLSKAAIVLYDGSATYPDLGALWKLAERAGITCMGLNAAFLSACEKARVEPARDYDVSAVRAIGSTGSPLMPESFRWVREHVGEHVWLYSISGGTDLCTAFLTACPLLSVYAGELQCRALGAAVDSFDESGESLVESVGELVLTKPMPSMPVCFWGDEDHQRLRDAYFSMYPGVWRHGDWVRLTARGGAVIYGRSDATINRSGVRVGTSEIYRAAGGVAGVVDTLAFDLPRRGGELWLMLFVVLSDGLQLDDALATRIKRQISIDCSPHHVPNEVRQIRAVPRTLSGKTVELPVKRIVMGAHPEEVLSRGSLSNPDALDYFLALAAEMEGGHRAPRDGESPELAQRLACVEASERLQVALDLVLSQLAALNDGYEDLDPERPFTELGVSSLASAELTVGLERAVGFQLPLMLTLEHPSPLAVATFLMARLGEAADGEGRSLTPDEELDLIVTELDRSSRAPGMPAAPFATRVKSSAWIWSLMPSRLMVRRAARMGAIAWENDAAERGRALALMHALLRGDGGTHDLHGLARAHLIESYIDKALFWKRPWSASLDEASAALVDEVLASDRGVLLSLCHLGPHYRLPSAAPFKRADVSLVAGRWFFEEPSPDEWGVRLARWRMGTAQRLLPAEGSFATATALLRRGEAIFVHFDVPGERMTELLGRAAMLADGTAQLAVHADALVLPLRARRRNHEVLVEAHGPLDPRSCSNAEALHRRLAKRHGDWIAEDLAAIEDDAASAWAFAGACASSAAHTVE